MGLFSKEPTEDGLFEMFSKLSEEQQASFKARLNGETAPAEEPKEEGAEEQAPTEGVQTTPQVEPENKPTFEELFNKFREEQKAEMQKQLKELDDKYSNKFAELSVKTESKPFGLTEGNKEYKATSKPKETSEEYLKRLFGK